MEVVSACTCGRRGMLIKTMVFTEFFEETLPVSVACPVPYLTRKDSNYWLIPDRNLSYIDCSLGIVSSTAASGFLIEFQPARTRYPQNRSPGKQSRISLIPCKEGADRPPLSSSP